MWLWHWYRSGVSVRFSPITAVASPTGQCHSVGLCGTDASVTVDHGPPMMSQLTPRFSLLCLFGVLTVCACVLAYIRPDRSLLSGPGPASILTLEALAALAVVEVLSRSLPAAIRRARDANCIRLDGSWSAAREQIERSALWKLRLNLLAASALAALPVNVTLYAVHTQVIPLPLAVEAASVARVPASDWLAELRTQGILDRYERLPNTNENTKRMLRQFWPIVVMLCLLAAAFGFSLFRSAHLASLNELMASIASRASGYELHDFQRRSDARV